jgi:hypothetical protein
MALAEQRMQGSRRLHDRLRVDIRRQARLVARLVHLLLLPALGVNL